MRRPILVAYATKRGSTQEVAEAIGTSLRERGLEVDVRAAAAVDGFAPYRPSSSAGRCTWAACTTTRRGS